MKLKSRKLSDWNEKRNLVDRFNKSVEDSDFLNVFQKIMTERLLLNKNGNYHTEEVKRILYRNRRETKSMNTNISGGLLLSTRIEAEVYINLQETLKKMTGKYQPMDEFLLTLIHWFCVYYSENSKKKPELPFIKNQWSNSIRNDRLRKFDKVFKQFYKNII